MLILRGRPFVAFGAFSPSAISRTRWDFVRYSVGKITLTDLLVPPHQVLNQANVISSPDHLRTRVAHRHQGFTVYSGGTPIDEFMSNEAVSPFTVLGDRTPPVPATQNLETRHGMVKVGTPLESVPAESRTGDCAARKAGYVCTLTPGHAGALHVSHGTEAATIWAKS